MAIKQGISIIIKLHSTSREYYAANIIAWELREKMREGVKVQQQWGYVYIPGLNAYRWIPETYYVADLV